MSCSLTSIASTPKNASASRAIVPSAFEGVLSLLDYGTSAMIAAWLGGLSAAAWMRYPVLSSRLGVIGFSLLCAGVGWLCRPDLTPLDSEHLVAYAIGLAAVSGAAWEYPRRVAGDWLAMAQGLLRRGYAVAGRLGLALRQQQV